MKASKNFAIQYDITAFYGTPKVQIRLQYLQNIGESNSWFLLVISKVGTPSSPARLASSVTTCSTKPNSYTEDNLLELIYKWNKLFCSTRIFCKFMFIFLVKVLIEPGNFECNKIYNHTHRYTQANYIICNQS